MEKETPPGVIKGTWKMIAEKIMAEKPHYTAEDLHFLRFVFGLGARTYLDLTSKAAEELDKGKADHATAQAVIQFEVDSIADILDTGPNPPDDPDEAEEVNVLKGVMFDSALDSIDLDRLHEEVLPEIVRRESSMGKACSMSYFLGCLAHEMAVKTIMNLPSIPEGMDPMQDISEHIKIRLAANGLAVHTMGGPSPDTVQ